MKKNAFDIKLFFMGILVGIVGNIVATGMWDFDVRGNWSIAKKIYFFVSIWLLTIGVHKLDKEYHILNLTTVQKIVILVLILLSCVLPFI